ncbi:MAG TPA: glycosyltransferase [Tepidisphaeraceae bacterium]|jgi:glycosyltransferase involved in cell wall biosynthesis|nr:glycosyltransferase [Tepidisphaeraceae bacterium]
MIDRHISGGPFYCTLVLPTFNASDFIGATVARLRRFLHNNPDWSVLFVCDGCTDDTMQKLLPRVQDLAPQIRVEAYEVNRGKGHALRRGLSMADTPYRIFTDVDLAYDFDEALKILNLLEAGADLAVANRASPDSQFLMSPRDFPTIYRRHLMSRAFNWWLRRMLPITILDTQAGLKGITAQAWDLLSTRITTEGFFFDVELLARAGAAGMQIDETPILVKYIDPTTVRMLSAGWSMIKDTVKLRRSLAVDAPTSAATLPK